MAKAKEAKAKKTTKTYHNFIGGEWRRGASGEYFENVNPADANDVIGRFPLSNEEDVNAAVEAAKEAAAKWRRTPAPRRAEFLYRLGEILVKNKDRFTREMTREMGKVLKEAGGDVQEAIDCTYFTAGGGRRVRRYKPPGGMPKKVPRCLGQTGGTRGLIDPLNFPLGLPSW